MLKSWNLYRKDNDEIMTEQPRHKTSYKLYKNILVNLKWGKVWYVRITDEKLITEEAIKLSKQLYEETLSFFKK